MTSRLANLSSIKAAKKIGASFSSLSPTRQEAKKPQQVEEEDKDEDEESEDEESEEKKVSSAANTKQISAKDLDWSQEEQQIVLKHYGLDSLFPNVWGDDSYQGRLQGGGDKSEPDVKTVIQDQDNADPLKVKGKVVRRRGYHKKGDGAPSVFISEKAFSPKFFLLETHKNTEYKELEQGAARLKQTIAERSETTKELIKKHFSKFVSAKSTVDSFYTQMRSKNLISKEDYGIAPFLRQLGDLEAEANKLYGPVLERRAKADKIRITLSILEQWKFFFNLASSLKEMIRTGKYDAAVRDYKKGKSIMQSSFSNDEAARQLVNDKFGKDASNLLPKNYQGVFEKLWVEVERVVKDFRDELFRSLRVMTNPVETQEKIINYLVDLDSKRDPVWCYLDTQYNWVLDSLVKVHTKHIATMNGVLKKMRNYQNGNSPGSFKIQTEPSDAPSAQSMDNLTSRDYLNAIKTQIDSTMLENIEEEDIRPSVAWVLNDVKKALMSVSDSSFETNFGSDVLTHYWKCTYNYVMELCDVLETHLPAFWRTCKMYTDGRSHKMEALKRATMAKRLQEGKTMMANIFEIIQISINYSFFLLIDDSGSDYQSSTMTDEDGENVEFSPQKLNDEKTPLVPLLKNLSSYGSRAQLESEMDEEAQQVWHTFQKVSESLEQLDPKEFEIFLKAHPIMLIHYATKIMNALSSTIAEIKPVYSGEDGMAVFQSFSITVETVKVCLVNNICQGVVQVFSNIHTFEDWSFENHTGAKPTTLHAKHDSTYLMKLCYKLGKFFLKSLSGIIQFSEKAEDTNSNIETIRISLFDSLFALLDGFEWQASQWRDPDDAIHFENVPGWVPDVEHVKLKTSVSEQKAVFGQFIPPECTNFVETVKPKDFRNQDSRNFIILCNINYLKKWMSPMLIDSFEERFNFKATLDALHYEETINNLEQIIILNYVKRQSQAIRKLVRTAVFYSGLDWASIQAPREIRPYCFHILHHLVNIHASISEVSKSLITTILSELLIVLSQELLLAFRQVDKYSIAGMLQATLETEFLDSTLKAFETPTSEAIFTQIYETVEKGTDSEVAVDPAKMNANLVSVKSFLNLAKSTTITQFRCFSTDELPPDWMNE